MTFAHNEGYPRKTEMVWSNLKHLQGTRARKLDNFLVLFYSACTRFFVKFCVELYSCFCIVLGSRGTRHFLCKITTTTSFACIRSVPDVFCFGVFRIAFILFFVVTFVLFRERRTFNPNTTSILHKSSEHFLRRKCCVFDGKSRGS